MPPPPTKLRSAACLPSMLVALACAASRASSFSFVPPSPERSRISDIGVDKRKGPTLSRSQRAAPMSMRVSRGRSRNAKESSLVALNNERRRTAGRVGTKNFVDPTKLFVGNVPFTATEDDLLAWFGKELGGTHNIDSLKIIRDWKTGKSKGYGFINFLDPIHATSAMETVRNRRMNGRILKLSQGQRKKDDPVLIVKPRKEQIAAGVDAEGDVINAGLNEAEEAEEEADEDELDEDALLAFVEKGGLGGFMGLSEEDAYLFGTEGIFEDEDDEDDFQYDGVFEAEYPRDKFYVEGDEEEKEQVMNREQRRDAARKRKRRKLPNKGFG